MGVARGCVFGLAFEALIGIALIAFIAIVVGGAWLWQQGYGGEMVGAVAVIGLAVTAWQAGKDNPTW
jgi:hypothetical protein